MESLGKNLRLVDLRKEFGDLVAVNDLNLEVKRGEFACLLGPSGCGKTTTLNMIAGLLEPTSGNIYVGDSDITELPPKARNVGLVFQNYAVFTGMSVYENLAFGLKVRKVPDNEIKNEVMKVAETLQLTSILDRKAAKLRLDEQQRTALGRSMITKPAFFLLDEPLSNLDASLRSFMRVELKRLQRELNQTILYVTHDQIEAMAMADRIAIMDSGKLQQYGTRSEVYDQPANRFVANFIGSPNMNFIDCSLVEKAGKAYLDTGEFQIDVTKMKTAITKGAKSSEQIIGVRPEDVYVEMKKTTKTPIRGTVYLIEPLGAKTIIDIKAGKSMIRSLVSGTFRPKIDDEIWMGFNMNKMHLIDRKTELTIF
jgi:multiple sugar transport system ATP-binding protein